MKRWFREFSVWKPWTWLREIRRLNALCKVKQAAYERCCASRDLAERQRDNMRDKLAYFGLKWQLAEKRARNIAEEMNEKSNEQLAKLDPDGMKIIETLKLPVLTHHKRVTQMGDWMQLEEYQKRAALPYPTLRIERKRRDA